MTKSTNIKYLINSNFGAIRFGEFVTADENQGEFIYETENDSHTLATLIEIAKANKLEVPHKVKKADLIELLNNHLTTLKLAEQSHMTDTQKVEQIIAEGVAAGKSDDEMLVEIISSGVSFKAAAKMFKSVMEAKGYRVSAKDRADQAAKILADAEFTPTTYEEVAEMATLLVSEIPDTNDKQAMIAIRNYAKAIGVDIPKKAKGAPGRTGGSSLLTSLMDWMLVERDVDDAAITAKIKEVKPSVTSKQLTKYVTSANRLLSFAKRWAA